MTTPNVQVNHLRNMTFNQTFQSSLIEDKNQKFTLDKSLIKGIKQNKVQKIIDNSQLSDLNTNAIIPTEYQDASQTIIQTRKRYDKIKTQTLTYEQQIQKIKSQKQLLLEDQSKFTNLIQKQKQDLSYITHKLQQISQIMESTQYRKDVYSNIKDSVKNDLLILKKRYFDKDIILLRENTKLRTLKNQHQSKITLSKKCRDMLTSVQKSVQIKQIQRTNKIHSVYDILTRKQMSQQNKQIREKDIREAAINAKTQKLFQEKQWLKMLNANLFTKFILKAKMQRIMNQYNRIDIAFHKMKQSTNIKDSNEVIEKYLSREETYGMLLQSIAEKEVILDKLRADKEVLDKIHGNLLYKGEGDTEQKKGNQNKTKSKSKSKSKQENLIADLNELGDHVMQIQRKKQMIYQWATKYLAAHSGLTKRDQIFKKYPKSHIKEVLTDALFNLCKTIDSIQSQQNSSKKINQTFLRTNPKQALMNGQLVQRNTRIKTLTPYEQNSQEKQDFDDKDMAYDNLSQVDFLQHSRRGIKKAQAQNRKFRIKTKPY